MIPILFYCGGLAAFIYGVHRTMAAIDSLNANLAALGQVADAIVAAHNAPPAPPADETAVQGAADTIAQITAELRATLPAPSAPTA